MLYTTVSRDQYLGDCLMVSGQTRHDYLAAFNSILSVRFLMHQDKQHDYNKYRCNGCSFLVQLVHVYHAYISDGKGLVPFIFHS